MKSTKRPIVQTKYAFIFGEDKNSLWSLSVLSNQAHLAPFGAGSRRDRARGGRLAAGSGLLQSLQLTFVA